MNPFAKRTREEMAEVLMDDGLSGAELGPEIHYYMIRGGTSKGNVTVWESGVVGGEYVKAYGHYHRDELEETYRVLSGEGIIIMQERAIDVDGRQIDDEIESFIAKRVRTGDVVNIPPRAGHLAINIGKTWFVTQDDSPVSTTEQKKGPSSFPEHADYSPFKKLRGAAYYVVDKNGEPTLIKNPNYKKVPDAKIE